MTKYEEKEEERLETLKEIYEIWKGINEFKGLTKSTKNHYERTFERFKALHYKPIKDIKYYQIQKVVDNMEADGYDKRNRKAKMKHHEYSKGKKKSLQKKK